MIKFIYKENHRKWCEIWGGESPSYAGLEKCIVIWKITMALNFTEGKDRADKCYNFCVASIKFSNPKHLKMLKVFFNFYRWITGPLIWFSIIAVFALIIYGIFLVSVCLIVPRTCIRICACLYVNLIQWFNINYGSKIFLQVVPLFSEFCWGK